MNSTVLIVCVMIFYVHSTPIGYYQNCQGNRQFQPQDYHLQTSQHKLVDKTHEESVSKNTESNSIELTTHKPTPDNFLKKFSAYKSILDTALTEPVKLFFKLKKSDQDSVSTKSSTNKSNVIKNENIEPELTKSSTNKTIAGSSITQTSIPKSSYIPNKVIISTPHPTPISTKTESSTHKLHLDKSIPDVISTESSISKSSSTTSKSVNLPTQKLQSNGTTFGSQNLLDVKDNVEESCGANQMRDYNGVCRDSE